MSKYTVPSEEKKTHYFGKQKFNSLSLTKNIDFFFFLNTSPYPYFLVGVWGMVLSVTVWERSLFHEEKFAFFDFKVRGTPKFCKYIRGSAIIFEKRFRFYLRREAALSARLERSSRFHQFPVKRLTVGRRCCGGSKNLNYFQNFLCNNQNFVKNIRAIPISINSKHLV